MMIQRWNVSHALAASVVVLLGASAARADVTWVIQPSQSTYTFLPQLGTVVVDANNNAIKDANGNYTFKELYNAVQQNSTNSPGTSFNPGYTNSQVTNESGTFTTVGNTFLSVLNFGPRPGTVPPPSPLVTFANNGTWVPNGPTGGPFPGTYGTPTPANAGAALTFVSGSDVPGPTNNNGDGGRLQAFLTSGDINSNNVTTPVTNGSFQGNIINFSGTTSLAINYNGIDAQATVSFPANGTVSYPTTLNLPGTITRGAGANSYQYVMTTSLPNQLTGTTGSIFYNFLTMSTNVAVANLAKGDVNFDGVVNGLDIAAVSSNWLQSNAQHLGNGDANGDGVVNGLDIALISSNWLGTTPPLGGGGGGGGAAVPEPGTLVLLGLGSLGLWLMRRRLRR